MCILNHIHSHAGALLDTRAKRETGHCSLRTKAAQRDSRTVNSQRLTTSQRRAGGPLSTYLTSLKPVRLPLSLLSNNNKTAARPKKKKRGALRALSSLLLLSPLPQHPPPPSSLCLRKKVKHSAQPIWPTRAGTVVKAFIFHGSFTSAASEFCLFFSASSRDDFVWLGFLGFICDTRSLAGGAFATQS